MTHLESVCPEWHDPGYSRKPIDLKEMLISEGKSEDEANHIIGKMEESQKLKEFFFAIIMTGLSAIQERNCACPNRAMQSSSSCDL